MTQIWFAVLLGTLGFAIVLAIGLWISWRTASEDDRALMRRVRRLPVRRQIRLAAALARDRRIPLRVRSIPPLVLLYLASPIDIIPDFIPVIGQLDDLLVLVIGARLLLRFAPRAVVEERLAVLEQEAPATSQPAPPEGEHRGPEPIGGDAPRGDY